MKYEPEAILQEYPIRFNKIFIIVEKIICP